MVVFNRPSSRSTKVKALGSTSARSLAAWFGDQAVLPAFREVIDVDDTNSFTRAIVTGKRVVVPYRDTPYVISTYINFPSNVELVGLGKGARRPTLKTSGTEPRVFRFQSVSDCLVDNIIIDGDKANKSGGSIATINTCVNIRITNCRLLNPKGPISISGGSVGCAANNNEIIGSGSHAIEMVDATTFGNEACRNYIESCTGFGVSGFRGAHSNLAEGNRCTTNGKELIGVTYDTWGWRIIGNHAQGTLDNGISITGFQHTIMGNQCIGNYHSGIFLYGSRNTCSGNVCKNNGQRFLVDGTDWAGIRMRPESGGSASFNIANDNICIDDQAVKTQAWGIRIDQSTYQVWTAGQTVSAGAYRFNGLNVYVATTAGTSGATPPTHTTGDVSDGGVTWRHLFTGTGNIHAQSNMVGLNQYFGNRLAGYSNVSGNTSNVVVSVAA